MNNLKEEELPPPGHVMTIIEALNKSNFLQMRDFSTLPLDSVKTRDNGTSLIHTRSTMSLSSSSYNESSFTDGVAGSIELEALYDHRYRPTCRSVPAKQTHVCDARYVCVCNKKKCEFLKNHEALTKSLNNLESSTSFQEPEKGNFRKYLTVARKIKSHSSNIIPNESKTLFPKSNKWNSLKAATERFQICENLAAEATMQSTYKPNKRVYAFHTFKKTALNNKDVPKENGTSFPATETLNGIHPSNGNLDIPDTTIAIKKQDQLKLCWNDFCKCMPLNPVRIFFIVFGILIFLTGVTFDHGLSHGVDSVLNTCWGWLREEYQTFGENFLEYQKYVFKNKGIPSNEPEIPFNSKFIYTLENTEFSVQMHFFDIKESAFPQKKIVKVNDVGPLYFNIYFKSNKGFEVKYVASKSNITLSSAFEVFDVMKAILLSNQLPYFGFHIKDHYQTTPTAFLNVFIDSLNKFQIDTSFFSTLQSQILGSAEEVRFKRSSHNCLKENSKLCSHVDSVNSVTKNILLPSSNINDLDIRTERSLNDPGDLKKSLKSLLNKFFLPLPLDIKKPVNFPVPTINRNLSLKYKDSIMMSGLEGYQFAICEEEGKISNKFSKMKDQNHPSNELLKPNSPLGKEGSLYRNPYSLYAKKVQQGISFSNFSVPSNVISLNPILLELIGKVYFLGKNLEVYPFWISSPHFISNQISNRLNTYPNLIDGMNPREDQHGSFVYYHPILGVPINASLAFQIGVYPPERMLYSHKLVPVMWVRFQLDKIPPSLWYLFWVSFYIRQILILILVFSGLGIILCALRCPCRCGKKCDEQMMV